MEEKRLGLLGLLDILRRYSDENHILSVAKINEHLKQEYDLTLDRRTIYKYISELGEFGYDISTYSDNSKGYYFVDRTFETSEVLLLCHVIHGSNLIPLKASKELIKKLLNTQSQYFQKDYQNAVFIENTDKKENKDFFLNIDLIAEAIKERKCIEFDYLRYNVNKELVSRREKKYLASPYYLVCKDSKVYLIAKSNSHNDITHYRVDKMRNIKVSNESFVNYTNDEDPYSYAKDKLYMYKDNVSSITIRFDNYILDDIIELFGTEISLRQIDENTIETRVKASQDGMLFLALQYLNHIEVVEPKELREKIKETLNKGIDKYSK